jgi:hypothetical protein
MSHVGNLSHVRLFKEDFMNKRQAKKFRKKLRKKTWTKFLKLCHDEEICLDKGLPDECDRTEEAFIQFLSYPSINERLINAFISATGVPKEFLLGPEVAPPKSEGYGNKSTCMIIDEFEMKPVSERINVNLETTKVSKHVTKFDFEEGFDEL